VPHPLYPVNLELAGRRCLVVGGGEVAAEKVEGLRQCDAAVHVVAPSIVAAITDRPDITWEQRPYRTGEVADYWFVVTATDDAEVNQAVRADGDAHRVWVNAADDPANCSAMLPARVRRGELLVTFSTGGASPALSAWLRSQGEEIFGPEYAELVALVAEIRRDRRARGLIDSPGGWRRAFDSGILDLVRQGRTTAAKELLEACLSSSSA
jgi:precorrin-2 dehydrogenase/sirohydrochlorin ferrochelatase